MATTATKTKATATTASKSNTKAKSPAAAKSPAKGQIKAKRSAAEELRELFVDGLKDIYWAEKALTKSLPKMSKNATSSDLKMAVDEHLTITEGQVTRLENIFALIGEKAVAKKCDAMDGLIKEAQSIMEESEPGAVRDAGIIAAAQKVEHYEIATYGTLAAWAKTIGETEAMEQLQMTLAEEKECDKLLTEKAYNTINFDAAEADGMDEKA
ncbi:ferritin-like domain-containing protein [Flavobacterium sp.]|uniref:YciE/YciF ferroxidase family protein n=1 Tax=Flavobacterium sp. TaxID=239 RepID=UPI001204D033|nr:ferritin-like domain-containing protein [Flavobacterium sp.]RZJ72557.1 MAG: ferritin-like domain-containing protein [Flavobacterium sp.]